MNTKKKILMALALVGCAVLLVAGSIAGTLAYLTAQTQTITNTFTVGNVAITLTETKTVDTKLIPGKEYGKDPVVTVSAGSEDCWLFVEVVDEIAAIQDTTTVAKQMEENGWLPVAGKTNVYAYNAVASAGDSVNVFAYFKIKGDVNNENLAAYANKTIKVTAYAVQAAGFADAATAWNTAFGATNP